MKPVPLSRACRCSKTTENSAEKKKTSSTERHPLVQRIPYTVRRKRPILLTRIQRTTERHQGHRRKGPTQATPRPPPPPALPRQQIHGWDPMQSSLPEMDHDANSGRVLEASPSSFLSLFLPSLTFPSPPPPPLLLAPLTPFPGQMMVKSTNPSYSVKSHSSHYSL